MYIRITNLCNMTCEHCAFSSGPDQVGTHMSLNTFCAAVDLAYNIGDSISIGGGEPTVHPEFWDFLVEAMNGTNYDTQVWLATNGKRPGPAILLAELASDPWEAYETIPDIVGRVPFEDWNDRFSVALSQDRYHDPIAPAVVTAFKQRKLEIRNVNGNIGNVGRAKETGAATVEKCCCTDLCVEPNGTVKACGCPDSIVLGHLHRDREELDDRLNRWANPVVRDRTGECGYYGLGLNDEDYHDEEKEFAKQFVLDGGRFT